MATPEQIAEWRQKHGVGVRQPRVAPPGDRTVGRYGQVFEPFAERGPEFGTLESARKVFLDAPATAVQIPATFAGEALTHLIGHGNLQSSISNQVRDSLIRWSVGEMKGTGHRTLV